MRILLDTNILILRENHHIVPQNLSQMMMCIHRLEHGSIWVHPLSVQEINKDGNEERKKINLSKITTYAQLESFPDYIKDSDFVRKIEKPTNPNDIIDNQLLYCVYRNVVDFLITEDQALLKKASLLGLEQQVLNINEAILFFESYCPNTKINLLPTFSQNYGYEVDLNDPIFDSLKQEYDGFENWWNKKVSRREVFLYKKDEQIGAILIPKIEINENIDCIPQLKRDKILKICTFKVADFARGLKLGECLIKMAINYAINNHIDEIYLTHFKQEVDYLIPLIESFGFVQYGKNSNGEYVYIKSIAPTNISCPTSIDEIVSFNKKFYPALYDGKFINKFIIPIKPIFHDKLFPDFVGKFHQLVLAINNNSEGHSINKAYICNTGSRLLKNGDVVLFYYSQTKMAVTTIGTIEKVIYDINDPNEILKLIAKKSVFTQEEIEEICKKPVTIILFNHNFNLKNEVSYKMLREKGIVNGYIQSITNISDEKYREIIKDNIDERFIIN